MSLPNSCFCHSSHCSLGERHPWQGCDRHLMLRRWLCRRRQGRRPRQGRPRPRPWPRPATATATATLTPFAAASDDGGCAQNLGRCATVAATVVATPPLPAPRFPQWRPRERCAASAQTRPLPSQLLCQSTEVWRPTWVAMDGGHAATAVQGAPQSRPRLWRSQKARSSIAALATSLSRFLSAAARESASRLSTAARRSSCRRSRRSLLA